jgi:methyl-accepting chemotaxis protein
VKSLAVQTAKATEDISSQILQVQNSTGKAVEAIGRIAHRMGEINNHTSAVAASVLGSPFCLKWIPSRSGRKF